MNLLPLDYSAPVSISVVRDAGVLVGRRIGVHLAVLVLIALLVPLHASWAAQLLLVPLLLIGPGLILLRALRIPGKAVLSFPVYVPCASLVVLLGSGLAVDLLGLLSGMSAPLRPVPMLAGLEVVCAGLLASSWNCPSTVDIPWSSLPHPLKLAWPLILPLVAAAGALRLNNGHGSGLALFSLCACVILLVTTFVIAHRIGAGLLAMILYAAGLAMMWSFSLRSGLVYGFDIASEYHAMQHTVVTGSWHPAHPGDAYGALLSITVLPAELHALSGVSGLMIFKVIYPAFGAMFPVAVFLIASRVLSRPWAFAAAAFIICQASFFQQLPGLARQEIALLLFAGMIAVILDARPPRYSQWILAGLFGLGMAVSHYSTTYLAVAILGLALAAQFAISWFRDVPAVNWPLLIACGVAAAAAAIWYAPVTESSSNVSQFISSLGAVGPDLLPNHAGNLLSSYLQGETTKQLQPAQYAAFAQRYYAIHAPFVTPLPNAGDPAYALRAPPGAPPAVTWPFGFNALNRLELVIQQSANLLAAIGALLIVLRRKTPVLMRQVGLLGFGAVVILTSIRLSGSLAQFYNPARAFLQTMAVLAIALCWSLRGLAGRAAWRQITIRVLAGASIAVLLTTAGGMAGAALNAGTSANLANSGGDYKQFYMTPPELAAAGWLGRAAQPGQLVYADRYAQLRLFAISGYRPGVLSDITPQTLDQNAWVYASRVNVADRIGISYLSNQSAAYAFPFGFLDANYNTVYSDGSSEVFHR
jgi:uncharacterized membrane protein